MNQIDLKGRRAVVTGGAQGIGRAVAERCIASGAEVILWDADATLGAATAGEIGARFVQVDVTDWEAVRAAGEAADAELAVMSAGIAGANAPVQDYPVDEWRRIIDINLNGTFYCCKALVPGMIARGYGRIVNIASIAGKDGNPNASAYSASKAGVINLTKALGKELAGHDIAVNCVTPAGAKTAIFDQMTDEHIAYMLSKVPRNRFVEVDEIASMIVWMLSAENSFTTAGVFDISGGRATY
ncbi:MAG: SDR family NAD(P)-dependent oxidoreductase [Pseudomonadota bacterium]